MKVYKGLTKKKEAEKKDFKTVLKKDPIYVGNLIMLLEDKSFEQEIINDGDSSPEQMQAVKELMKLVKGSTVERGGVFSIPSGFKFGVRISGDIDGIIFLNDKNLMKLIDWEI